MFVLFHPVLSKQSFFNYPFLNSNVDNSTLFSG